MNRSIEMIVVRLRTNVGLDNPSFDALNGCIPKKMHSPFCTDGVPLTSAFHAVDDDEQIRSMLILSVHKDP